jgi:hypothetical protein
MHQQTTKIPELIDPQATTTMRGLAGARIMAEFAAATER